MKQQREMTINYDFFKSFDPYPSALSLFMEGIILPVGDDDMIQKVNSHDVTGSLDGFGQFIILLTGSNIAWRVVMADGQDGAVG